MLSDEELKNMIRLWEGKGMYQTAEALRDLLTIRERAAQLKHVTVAWCITHHGTCTPELAQVIVKAANYVAYGDGAQAPRPERLYSEEEVRALLNALNEQMRPGDYIDIEAAMRRLRGEGEAKPVCPNCRQPLAPSAIAKTRWVCNNEHCARGHISASEVGVDP